MSGVATQMSSSVPVDMVARVLVDVEDMLKHGDDFSKFEAGFSATLPLKVEVPIFDGPFEIAYVEVAMGKVHHHSGGGVTIHGENAEIPGQYVLAHILPGQPEDASWLRLWIKDW